MPELLHEQSAGASALALVSPAQAGAQPDLSEIYTHLLATIRDLFPCTGAAVPLGPIQRLPINVIMNEKGLSTMLNKGERPRVTVPLDSDPEMPDTVVKKKYHYTALRFQPDGSTDLPLTGAAGGEGSGATKGDPWYLTLHGTNVKKGASETDGETSILPDNYFTLQIDPVTGTTRSYRPNVGK